MSSSLQCNFVFYEKGQFPQVWTGSPQGNISSDIRLLVDALLKSPLFGTGSCLGPRYYADNGLRQVNFLKSVRDEPVFFWDKNTKREGVTELDKIVIRGVQFVEGEWVVYYSMLDSPDRLYGILYRTFQDYAKIHFPETPFPKKYDMVIAGPNLSSSVQTIMEKTANVSSVNFSVSK